MVESIGDNLHPRILEIPERTGVATLQSGALFVSGARLIFTSGGVYYYIDSVKKLS